MTSFCSICNIGLLFIRCGKNTAKAGEISHAILQERKFVEKEFYQIIVCENTLIYFISIVLSVRVSVALEKRLSLDELRDE